MPKDLKEDMNKSSNIFGENTNSKGNDKKMVQDMQVEMEFLFKLKLR